MLEVGVFKSKSSLLLNHIFFQYSSIVHCKLFGSSIVSRKMFTFSFANSEYAFSLCNNLGSLIWRCGLFKLSVILLMFLDLFLFTSVCVFWCFYLCIFFVFHFYFKFYFPGGRWQICISVSFPFCRPFFLPWFNKFTFSSWLVRFYIVAFVWRLFFTKS